MLANWLDLEARRLPFSVAQVEKDQQWQRGALMLKLRLDRIDALDDGRKVIVDYKTGASAKPNPTGRAAVNVQLPFYASVLGPPAPRWPGWCWRRSMRGRWRRRAWPMSTWAWRASRWPRTASISTACPGPRSAALARGDRGAGRRIRRGRGPNVAYRPRRPEILRRLAVPAAAPGRRGRLDGGTRTPAPRHARRAGPVALVPGAGAGGLARNDELGWHLLEHRRGWPSAPSTRSAPAWAQHALAVRAGRHAGDHRRRARTTRPRPAPRWIWPTISRKSASCWNTWMWTCRRQGRHRRHARPARPVALLLAHGSDREHGGMAGRCHRRGLAGAVRRHAVGLGRGAERPGAAGRDAAAGGREDNKLAALLDWTDELPPDAFALDAWRALAHLLLTGTGSLRKTVNKNLGFPAKCAHKEPFVAWLEGADADAPWVRRLDAARDIPDPAFTDAQWRVLRAAHDLEAGGGAAAAALLRQAKSTSSRSPSARRRRWAMPTIPANCC